MIKINGIEASLGNNYRINQYYQKGSVIRPRDETYSALTIFTENDFSGQSAGLKERIIYKGSEIPSGMDNATRSFVLKRGYMATFAVKPNGTSKGKVYIASEEDMLVENLPVSLDGNVSFIRVVPWNWVTKKGTGGFFDRIDASWYYNWGLGQGSRPNYENAAMAWGAGGASPSSVNTIINREDITHFLGFNESDHCTGQSGQFNNLCEPEVAVAYFEGLLASGLRIGSPAPRENGPFTWLREFNRIAKERDVRFDFVAVHWYDWGGNPANTPNANPQQIFNRFRNYLEQVYNEYQMPIWITEFNANPNRGNAVQEAFLQLALPYLESLEYVERYAYFQPNPNNSQNQVEPSNYLDDDGNLTNIGLLFLNHESTPSIPQPTYAPANNLEGMEMPYIPKEVNSLIFEAECGKYLGSQWDILSDPEASNEYFIQGNPDNDGETQIARQVHFEFEIENPETYRAWIRVQTGGVNAPVRVRMDNGELEQIGGFNSEGFTWFQIPRFYDLKEGKHRMTLEFPNPNMKLDQVGLINGSLNMEDMFQDAGYCVPTDNFWGLEETDAIEFFEAEDVVLGASWTVSETENAIGGLFVQTADVGPSLENPPGTEGVLTLDFEVEEADEYEIWAKIQAVSEEVESSIWISVDGDPFRKMADLQNSIYEWYWKPFHFSYESEQRRFSYFLESGTHTLKVAYSSGNVFLDRFALVTKGNDPSDEDPDIIFLEENLEFEAEHAELLGSSVIVNCVNSSNGQQVNMGSSNNNGIRFDEIVADESGSYNLEISYMSAPARNFRLVVNGENLGMQSVESSGVWCFNGGSPAVYEIEVQLNEGVNSVVLRPLNGDSPLIDKIKFEKLSNDSPGLVSLEAEEAELLGNSAIQNCENASNGLMVNMGANVNNGIRFSNIVLQESKIYDVEIHYITANERSMTIVNGITSTQETFEPSGPWCFNGGEMAIKTVQMELEQGPNFVELRPDGTDAPIIDKIVILDQGNLNMRVLQAEEESMDIEKFSLNPEEFKVYPNPVKVGENIIIQVPGVPEEGEVIHISMTDMTGRQMYDDTVLDTETQSVLVDRNLSRGLYLITIRNGNRRYVWKLKVD
ncbi:glycosyl hydrolase [Mongoliibacter sp.]|uniref:glycosyl hydrolase n=1 Tax=Mongoliibacter sp. TaxID=2022438 RepID=UPI0025F107F5|nr:glycosyl hydrolase [Mongoliibacter sp.]